VCAIGRSFRVAGMGEPFAVIRGPYRWIGLWLTGHVVIKRLVADFVSAVQWCQ